MLGQLRRVVARAPANGANGANGVTPAAAGRASLRGSSSLPLPTPRSGALAGGAVS
mgnify:CR=1 FL=1